MRKHSERVSRKRLKFHNNKDVNNASGELKEGIENAP